MPYGGETLLASASTCGDEQASCRVCISRHCSVNVGEGAQSPVSSPDPDVLAWHSPTIQCPCRRHWCLLSTGGLS